MALDRDDPRESLRGTYDRMRTVNGTTYEGVSLIDYAELVEDSGRKRRSPAGGGVFMGGFGAIGHAYLLLWTLGSLVSGDWDFAFVLAPFIGITYAMMVWGVGFLSGGRNRGETGVHYVGRMVVAPYAIAYRGAVKAARATPGAARDGIRWLTEPKREEVSDE